MKSALLSQICDNLVLSIYCYSKYLSYYYTRIIGSELSYHLYPTPYKSLKQKKDPVTQLRREWEQEREEVTRYNLTPQWIVNGKPLPEVKVMGKKRKGGIDWFIYCERIQIPLLYPFALAAQA